ncbi:hypothetical protein A6769_33930 [Nostoc punctiforme NIES-2108]|uniref:Uncharacterized protein n=1 Tax=Nostoc punctiforme NIES-2108 TaxID=1356359 RepID=A0A367R330_NOSPU|nr:hypothetical protein A6769_33930 [Nostoc punctiforme NIES-2108]
MREKTAQIINPFPSDRSLPGRATQAISTEQEQAVDASPTLVIEQGQQSYKDADKRKLKAFVQAAEKLQGGKDQKLQSCIATVESLLKDEMNPIVWCRYIATANYVADALRQKLEKKGSQIRVIAITGELSEDERETRLEELKSYPSSLAGEAVTLDSQFYFLNELLTNPERPGHGSFHDQCMNFTSNTLKVSHNSETSQ